jgi:predicted ATPase
MESLPTPTPYLRRVTLRNYKSIAACKLNLPALAFLVGPNGSGKSNFLDSLGFVADALETSLDHALRERGTIREVRRRSGGHPNHFSIGLDFQLPNSSTGHFSFRVGAKPNGGFEVQQEECKIEKPDGIGPADFYVVQAGRVIDASFGLRPACVPDRLYLVAVSGLPEFRPVFDALTRIEIYNLNPKEIATMQKPDPGELLRRDGSNLASVFQNLPEPARRLTNEYLARIVPGIKEAEAKTLGSLETLEFRQVVKSQTYPWRFLASSMSDGTLRALGILVSIFQAQRLPMIVGLEEPEMALHPAAAAVLLSALRVGSRKAQILVTSHSPDLLDNSDIPPDSIFAVDNVDGVTRIGMLDPASKKMLRENLFTAGELLRQNQLAPDPSALIDVESDRQLGLFDFHSK